MGYFNRHNLLDHWSFNALMTFLSFFTLVQLLEPHSLEVAQVLHSLSYPFLLKQSSHQLIMVISIIITCKWLHYGIEILFLLCSLSIQLLLLLNIQYFTIDNELLPPNSLT
jgi:hypothetical protein